MAANVAASAGAKNIKVEDFMPKRQRGEDENVPVGMSADEIEDQRAMMHSWYLRRQGGD